MNYQIDQIRDVTSHRWLYPGEILYLLVNWTMTGIKESQHPSQNPSNGDLFLFDRKIVKDFKIDGVSWVKKKNEPNRVREDFVRFYAGDVQLTGFYTYCSYDARF